MPGLTNYNTMVFLLEECLIGQLSLMELVLLEEEGFEELTTVTSFACEVSQQ